MDRADQQKPEGDEGDRPMAEEPETILQDEGAAVGNEDVEM